MTNKKQNNQSVFHYLIFDWQLKMERTNDTLIKKRKPFFFLSEFGFPVLRWEFYYHNLCLAVDLEQTDICVGISMAWQTTQQFHLKVCFQGRRPSQVPAQHTTSGHSSQITPILFQTESITQPQYLHRTFHFVCFLLWIARIRAKTFC